MASVGYKNVSKVYAGDVLAINNVSLEIEEGEFAVFVGPSGCGKTTLIRMLAGLENPTSGELLIDGKVVNNTTPQKRNTAMVFQNYALYPHMTVRQNLRFPLKMRKVRADEIEAEIKRASDILELGALLDRKPGQLSGGQRQRVAMGRAIVRKPSVFLMDEPLSNLDAKLRTQIRSDIAALQRRLQTTTIYVTHDQVEAMTLGHRVCVLKEGTIHQVGEPREIFDKPADAFVAKFFGNPGMNLLPVKARVGNDGELEISIDDKVISLRGEITENVSPNADEPLLLGFRPETLAIAQSGNETNQLDLIVKATELIGHEQLVHLEQPKPPSLNAKKLSNNTEYSNGAEKLVARISSSVKVIQGEKIPICFKTGYLHMFKEHLSQERICSFLLKEN
jgi:multiple sugar transport system ATP-binding protein